MKVALWAEIRRLFQVEGLSRAAIARRLRCSEKTVRAALALERAPEDARRRPRGSRLDPHKPKIDALVARYPELSAARILEEIRPGPDGYAGGLTVLREYLAQTRPRRGRVYQEVAYEPGQAMQVDWGHCGPIQIGGARRQVSVFVAVLCYSRLCYLEFCLSQRKAEFYRSLVHSLEFFGGSPRRIIFDNLKAAFDTDEVAPAIVSSHARVHFDGNRYSVPPDLCDQTVLIRADAREVRIVAEGVVVARHARCYDRRQLLVSPDHRLEALKLRQRGRVREVADAFDGLGEEARQFHRELLRLPVRTSNHLRRVLDLVRLYGRREILAALKTACEFRTYDAAYAETYREVLDEAARKNSSSLEAFSALIADEITARRQRALQRRIKQAKLPKPKTLAEYDFDFPKRVPKQKVLRLFDGEFVEQRKCAVLIGPTGTGKTHLLTALAYAACEKGLSVRFTRVIDMINALTAAQVNGTLERALKQYVHPSLLLLDELGYLPVDKRGADLMFQVVAARYESGSIVISTNRSFRDWGKIFDVDNTLATAMIDRLMHHGEAIVIQGESYRTKDHSHAE